MPLAAKELCRQFARLWATQTAAKRWLEKDPLKPNRDIIRVWGVFVDYKPKRQRRWSKALVRRGADPLVVLAAVLGVAPEDIQVGKEPAGQEPPATANTIPGVRPSPTSPSPNREVAEQPSNAGPGFPSGDN